MDWQEIFKVMKNKDVRPVLLYSKAIIYNERTDKELPRQEKAQGVHQTSII